MAQKDTIRLSDCWAKTWQDGPHEGLPGLSVRDHCLQVGAVAELLWSVLPYAARQRMPASSVLLAATHDIGKLTAGFQQKCEDWRRRWLMEDADRRNAAGSEKRHAVISQLDLEKRLVPLGGKPAKRWAVALGGHHGRFTVPFQIREFRSLEFGTLRDELAEILTRTFGPLAVDSLPAGGPEHTARICLLTGFIIASDWIGSNTDWFPLAAGIPDSPAEEAAVKARKLAAQALNRVEWRSLSWQEPRDFGSLFDISYAPSDLQRKAHHHITAPGLYIVEAPMGTGKTEAALWAAFGMIRSGAAGGLYFALPTQLTSNSIHQRLGKFATAAGGSAVRVPLIHSASWLKSAESLIFSSGGDEDESEYWSYARSWFTQRRALLASLGAGTIDQALMGTLPVKYAALRLFGLAGKVVVFDEVHSYDVYTGTVLDCLIRLLRQLGCTVIILSATLTQVRRRDLLGLPPGIQPAGDAEAYPAITCAPEGAPPAIVSVERDSRMMRTVTLEHRTVVTSGELDADLLERATSLAEEGACVLIVRNTVNLAQNTWAALKPAVREGVEVGLIHSRFPHFLRHGDDSTNLVGRESEWVEKLGKVRDQRPSGCILVGTQVLEQSLDIDADFLITDLCPIDLLLQRLGRLHRHEVPPKGLRPFSCRQPQAIVLHPVLPTDDEPAPKAWKAALRPHGNIYAPIVLLRTQAVLRREVNGIPVRLPDDIRHLIERVYESQATGEPAAWPALEKELLDKKETLRQRAKAFANDPIGREAGSDDEQTAATRIIDCPTVPLILLRELPETRAGGSVVLRFLHGPDQVWNPHEPWKHSLARAIFLNAVNIPLWWVKAVAYAAPPWLARHVHGAATAAVVLPNGSLDVLTDKEENAELFFSLEKGVCGKGISCRRTEMEPEDSWN